MGASCIARLTQVTRRYSLGATKVTALDELSLEVKSGSFTFITGQSGSGKTTALNMLGAIDSPDQGTVEVLGQNLSRLNDNALTDFRSQHIGYIF